MANKTKIEWTATYNEDGTVTPGFNWNFLRGCSRVSEGCRNCYAEGVAARFSGPGQPYEGLAKFVDHKPRWTGEIGFIEDVLMKPLRWKKPRKIFVNSMSDLFHEKVQDEWLDRAFAIMALTPQHTYQVLTKRPERMQEYFRKLGQTHSCDGNMALSPLTVLIAEHIRHIPRVTAKQGQQVLNAMVQNWPLPNVWLGVSVEDQKTADERIPILLETPAAVRFLSMEPLLGPVRLDQFPVCDGDPNNEGYGITAILGLDWVVVGGESGPNARPMHPDWARSIRDQCQAAGVPFFFKQWGEWAPATSADMDGNRRNIKLFFQREECGYYCDEKIGHVDHGGQYMNLVGKKKAGRLLDGREWNEYPEVNNAR